MLSHDSNWLVNPRTIANSFAPYNIHVTIVFFFSVFGHPIQKFIFYTEIHRLQQAHRQLTLFLLICYCCYLPYAIGFSWKNSRRLLLALVMEIGCNIKVVMEKEKWDFKRKTNLDFFARQRLTIACHRTIYHRKKKNPNFNAKNKEKNKRKKK